MRFVDAECVTAYAADDWIRTALIESSLEGDDSFAAHKWLCESLPKRALYALMYGDLLRSSVRRSLLDVGGAFSSLSRKLITAHDYGLVDISAHDAAVKLRAEEARLRARFWVGTDWYEFTPRRYYDLVIASDLFPNVDQRLSLFMKRYLPCCTELRIALTYYSNERWYRVKRTDADEIMHLLAWDGAAVARALSFFEARLVDARLSYLCDVRQSAFANGRQVAVIRLRGDQMARKSYVDD